MRLLHLCLLLVLVRFTESARRSRLPQLLEVDSTVYADASNGIPSLLADEESHVDTQPSLEKKLPHFYSPYLACDDDSDCCRNSRCMWPERAVQGTTDHKTCILNGSGGNVPEVFCATCDPPLARYRNGECNADTAKFYDKSGAMKSLNGTGSDNGQLVGTEGEGDWDESSSGGSGSSRRRRKKRTRLPETNVPGETPHTDMSSDAVDELARQTLVDARETKCSATDEWCPEMMNNGLPELDLATIAQQRNRQKAIMEELMEFKSARNNLK